MMLLENKCWRLALTCGALLLYFCEAEVERAKTREYDILNWIFESPQLRAGGKQRVGNENQRRAAAAGTDLCAGYQPPTCPGAGPFRGLMDPNKQKLFVQKVTNALDPDFVIYTKHEPVHHDDDDGGNVLGNEDDDYTDSDDDDYTSSSDDDYSRSDDNDYTGTDGGGYHPNVCLYRPWYPGCGGIKCDDPYYYYHPQCGKIPRGSGGWECNGSYRSGKKVGYNGGKKQSCVWNHGGGYFPYPASPFPVVVVIPISIVGIWSPSPPPRFVSSPVRSYFGGKKQGKTNKAARGRARARARALVDKTFEEVTIIAKFCATKQNIGLVDPTTGEHITTEVWGYAMKSNIRSKEISCSWPGPTIESWSGKSTQVTWENHLPRYPFGHLLTSKDGSKGVVDESVHWAYGLVGYTEYTLKKDGVPVVTHLHGGHSDSEYDGGPNEFFSPNQEIKGPCYVTNEYIYQNDQQAAALWYHDHALGITRHNVYAGLAGFYVIRDDDDTGRLGNTYDLPVFPYEVALAIQDRMFKKNGELFYPAFPCDPYYADFIDEEGACPPLDNKNKPLATALAEFFGDFMVVNGKIWPKMDVEPRLYRFRLLNGCDSRFLVVEFCVAADASSDDCAGSERLSFTVIGSDQGLGLPKTGLRQFVLESSARQDVLLNFSGYEGQRIIMKNLGGDEPFGGDIPGPVAFAYTDRIMAFDVMHSRNTNRAEKSPKLAQLAKDKNMKGKYKDVDNVRRVGLFEGRDERGRLKPLLGTVAYEGDKSLDGSLPFSRSTTETPALGSVEEWEIWNFSPDAHPIHIHLVFFEVVGRNNISFNAIKGGEGLTEIPLLHTDDPSSAMGTGYKVEFINGDPESAVGAAVELGNEPYMDEGLPRDVVTALPGTITKIRATYDKQGQYVWHCHILSHEDNDMMRVFQVGEVPHQCNPEMDTHG